jgi:hypothetical protein
LNEEVSSGGNKNNATKVKDQEEAPAQAITNAADQTETTAWRKRVRWKQLRAIERKSCRPVLEQAGSTSTMSEAARVAR